MSAAPAWRLSVAAVLALAPGGAGTEGPANRLAGEMSPYLRLHAHNPVDWYPWGEEALARARAEDKPIFLSVGYSTCYWCHVMEREVFSDPEIAARMNEWFVNIKVDREERPELDEIYMTATQLLTGRGGWPNSVFLTPELEPFFAGTYFPPTDRQGMPGFPRVLEGLHTAWTERREEVSYQAKRVTAAVREALTGEPESAGPPPRDAVDGVVEALHASYDGEWGGFGQGQKFPSPANLRLLWDRARAGGDEDRRRVLATLGHMGRGAIYDQLDGGFHRYTLDRSWRVPHFEKMLYDNAQLGELLAIAAGAQADPELERLARGTLDFVLDWMTLPNGAFKSAIDAETDAVEGAYYIWTRDELETVLGPQGFALLAPIFGFDGEPNFEKDHYTLYLTAPLARHAERLEIDYDELLARLEPWLTKLRRERSRREFPLVDDKVLTDWNGMMIAALARAGVALGEPRYLGAARRAAVFLLTLEEDDGTLLHVWRSGEARVAAFLDDYAFLIDGLLALDEAGVEGPWRGEARRLAEQMEERLAAPGGGYFASGRQPHLLVRSRPAGDGAVPSANGVAALNLLRLAERTGEAVYRRRAARALGGFARDFEKAPYGTVTLARALDRYHLAQPTAMEEPAGAPPTLTELARSRVRATGRWSGGADLDSRPFEIDLVIENGWHVNANPASLDFLIATALGGRVLDAVYPPGRLYRFAFAEEEVSVYSGAVTLAGETALSTEAVELTYQACDETRCLPPVTVEVPLAEGR